MKKLIVANWKDQKNSAEAAAWLKNFVPAIQAARFNRRKKEAVIAPAHFLLTLVAEGIRELDTVALAAQDLSPYPAGSYTGAISAENLEGLGLKYTLVGHSERRRHFAETHELVAQKVELALAASLIPIVCLDLDYLQDQAEALTAAHLKKCVVAYEPLAAIGSGLNEEPRQVKQAVKRIKRVFGQIPVLYGGSVTPKNISQYQRVADGVLVGGASLEAVSFVKLVEQA
jgi:triosephosphate isomerase